MLCTRKGNKKVAVFDLSLVLVYEGTMAADSESTVSEVAREVAF